MKSIFPRITGNLSILGIVIAAFLLCAFVFFFARWPSQPVLIGATAIVLVYVSGRGMSNRWGLGKGFFARKGHKLPEKTAVQTPETAVPTLPPSRKPVDPNDIDALVEQMLVQDRFALLLRPQIAGNLSEEHFGRALRALEEYMALVPDGDVQLEEGDSPRIVSVQRFFLDRYPVTNRQFYEFVAADGYRKPALWDEAILPGVLEFIDRTGNPGPKYWQNSCYLQGEEKHPVVGVSWYEAAAYARWVGKRLPSDAEWVKAGGWPVRISSTTQVQRKYPWGDSMNRTCAISGVRGRDIRCPSINIPPALAPEECIS